MEVAELQSSYQQIESRLESSNSILIGIPLKPLFGIVDSSGGYFAPIRRSKPLWDLAIIVGGGISMAGPGSPRCPDWSQV